VLEQEKRRAYREGKKESGTEQNISPMHQLRNEKKGALQHGGEALYRHEKNAWF